MQFFADDCEFYMPRGKEPSGTHYVERIRVRGVDLLEFRDVKISKKDSYWKIVDK